ncbi:lipoprotein signal peptidase [Deltaproteobacteria bacterium]|nr:lipoprotein signal peptidase [Deltaproteobacteria bacterium]
MSPKARVFLITTSAVVALDQLTKYWVRANIRPYSSADEVVIIPNWLSISHAINKGAAFSALADFEYRLAVFFTFTAIAVVVIGVGYRMIAANDRLVSAALGTLLAGALGNFIDRLWAGQVTDMIKVYAGSEPAKSWCISHFGMSVWPIFNIADTAIWVGVGGFLLAHAFVKDQPADSPPADGPQESAPSLD